MLDKWLRKKIKRVGKKEMEKDSHPLITPKPLSLNKNPLKVIFKIH